MSLQQRHWRDDFDLTITDRDISMHSIIISQKHDDAVHRNISIRYYKIKNHPSSVSTANSINDEGDISKVVRLTH